MLRRRPERRENDQRKAHGIATKGEAGSNRDDTGIVIGLDGGGSYTRAVCADMAGTLLARAETGASHPRKNPDAEHEVRAAMLEVLARAGRRFGDVRGCVAGLAGLNSADDLIWAERLLTMAGTVEKAHCVNDAVVAWAGALTMEPGIVAIGGTGAVVLGVTETGRRVRDYDFRHYGKLRARDLATALVHQIVIGEAEAADAELAATVCEHYGVGDTDELARLISTCEELSYETYVHQYGSLAPAVTAAALDGSPLARRVCDAAVEAMAVGIRLVGSQFARQRVRVALIGGVMESLYVAAKVAERLRGNANRQYDVVEARMPPASGAALMALDRCGVPLTAQVVDKLAMS